MVVFDNIKKSVQHSFSDYINANLQLSLVTCIDFTGSNGKASSKDSLHYCNNKTESVYEKALTEVTNILMNYDYDKLVPVYGFGARVRHPNLDTERKVHHCFPINGNIFCITLEGSHRRMQKLPKNSQPIHDFVHFDRRLNSRPTIND